MDPSQAIGNSYQTGREHQLGLDILRPARDALEAAGAHFSVNAIKDASTRARYVEGIQRISRMVQEEVTAGRMTAAHGAEFCQAMRNQIMVETRKVTSAQALPFAQVKKADGLAMDALLDRYAQRLFNKPFRLLGEAEKDRAYYAVIESAGRSNVRVTIGTARIRTAGKVGILLTATLAGYAIVTANDRMTEAARQGTVVGGGMLGGALAGLAISSICGPGAPFCAIAVLLIGSTSGAIVSDAAFDAYMDEVREFQAWQIR